jgi:hypothetical protein
MWERLVACTFCEVVTSQNEKGSSLTLKAWVLCVCLVCVCGGVGGTYFLWGGDVPEWEGFESHAEGLSVAIQQSLLHLGIARTNQLFLDARQASAKVRLAHLLPLTPRSPTRSVIMHDQNELINKRSSDILSRQTGSGAKLKMTACNFILCNF